MSIPVDPRQEELVRLRQMVRDTIALFEEFGVVPGEGRDGILLQTMQNELAGSNEILSIINKSGPCPLCHEPDYRDCDCPVDEQMAAMGA
jgi:hypothetical protein